MYETVMDCLDGDFQKGSRTVNAFICCHVAMFMARVIASVASNDFLVFSCNEIL